MTAMTPLGDIVWLLPEICLFGWNEDTTVAGRWKVNGGQAIRGHVHNRAADLQAVNVSRERFGSQYRASFVNDIG